MSFVTALTHTWVHILVITPNQVQSTLLQLNISQGRTVHLVCHKSRGLSAHYILCTWVEYNAASRPAHSLCFGSLILHCACIKLHVGRMHKSVPYTQCENLTLVAITCRRRFWNFPLEQVLNWCVHSRHLLVVLTVFVPRAISISSLSRLTKIYTLILDACATRELRILS
jgi:hypothetical protein